MLYLLLFLVVVVNGQYEVPDAKVEVFFPKGFKVSIPDEPGIKLFAFHGKINEEFDGREAGTFARDIIKAKDGFWTFTDRITKLKEGDIIYYWLYVDYFDGRNKLGYVKDDQKYLVRELINSDVPQIDIRQPFPHEADTSTNSKVLFFDDFSSNSLNSDKWQIEQKFADAPDYEFTMYVQNPKTLAVNNNNLKITPVLSEDLFGEGFVTSKDEYDFADNCTGLFGSSECRKKYEAGFMLPPVASSQISTKNKFKCKYGKIEIRAKLPSGNWIYPELYLNPAQEVYGPYYKSGQIRIAFAPGNLLLNKILQGGIILGHHISAREYGIKTVEQNAYWSDDFHTFVVDWQPNSITLSVDGRIYGRVDPPSNGFAQLASLLRIKNADRWKSGSKMAPFDQEMYLTIGVGVGGFSFKDSPSKPWRNGKRNSLREFYDAKDTWYKTWGEGRSMEVDYVRITDS